MKQIHVGNNPSSWLMNGLVCLPDDDVIAASPLVKEDEMTRPYRIVLRQYETGFCIHAQLFDTKDNVPIHHDFHQGDYFETGLQDPTPEVLGDLFVLAFNRFIERCATQAYHCAHLGAPPLKFKEGDQLECLRQHNVDETDAGEARVANEGSGAVVNGVYPNNSARYSVIFPDTGAHRFYSKRQCELFFRKKEA